MSELVGIHARRRVSSPAMECGARWLLEREVPCTARTIYENMTFKNGKSYRSSRYAITYGQFLGRALRSKAFIRTTPRGVKPVMFTSNEEAYSMLRRN